MTDKERLEEIKNGYFEWQHRLFGTSWVSMPKESFDWLIEQAERVELLERENKALNDMLTTLEKQDITKLLNQNVRLIKQNKRYHETLKYYADEKHYEAYCIDGYGCDVTEDGGEIARKALEGEE